MCHRQHPHEMEAATGRNGGSGALQEDVPPYATEAEAGERAAVRVHAHAHARVHAHVLMCKRTFISCVKTDLAYTKGGQKIKTQNTRRPPILCFGRAPATYLTSLLTALPFASIHMPLDLLLHLLIHSLLHLQHLQHVLLHILPPLFPPCSTTRSYRATM